MTVSVVMAGLLPILWSTGVGSDIMKPIAVPIVGGMVTSTIHVLIITPSDLFHHEASSAEAVHPSGVWNEGPLDGREEAGLPSVI